MTHDFFLAIAVALAATLYASVGHGGASAYLAILTLAGRVRPEIAVTVLVMNVLVSSISWFRFRQARHFDLPLTAAFLLFSAPAAFVGGLLPISPRLFSLVLGCALVAAAARLLLPDPRPHVAARPQGKALWIAAAVLGTSLGLLSGLTGVGGGLYLSPLLLFLGWKDTKGAAGISSAFIAINSVTGIAGRLVRGEAFDPSLWPLVAAAVLGGLIGARYGASHATPITLRRLLGLVLLIAGAKLLFGGG
ncbi:MAG: hypothetical protein A3F90_04370 [Deltaproteobacteria bacterium RIFCSPLOWO2_12_FULL_60_19]|nr:MAG: hypothetical protein A3F90_04370 [Deltaproteobacteria bacterium RIFCSPLOWO2_12_FULL_60_19]